MVRLSIGIEDPRDIINDLALALDIAGGISRDVPKFSDGYDSRFEDLPVLPKPPSVHSNSTNRPAPSLGTSAESTRQPPSSALTSRETSPATSAVDEFMQGGRAGTQPLSNVQAGALGAVAAFAAAALVSLLASRRKA